MKLTVDIHNTQTFAGTCERSARAQALVSILLISALSILESMIHMIHLLEPRKSNAQILKQLTTNRTLIDFDRVHIISRNKSGWAVITGSYHSALIKFWISKYNRVKVVAQKCIKLISKSHGFPTLSIFVISKNKIGWAVITQR